MNSFNLLVVAISTCILAATSIAAPLKVDTNVDAGNAVVLGTTETDVRFKTDTHDINGWWFYWKFDVENTSGKTIRLINCDRNNVFEAQGVAYSFDNGKTWQYSGRNAVDYAKKTFTQKIPDGINKVSYSIAIPYLEKNFSHFWDSIKNRPDVKKHFLCKTKADRENFYYTFQASKEPKYKIVITARHHACEMTANWALEGFLRQYLADDECGKWYRENVAILAIPFIDLDGVVEGSQGKNRIPHDHNRDYIEEIYPTIKAAKKTILKWGGDNLVVAIDFHCPYISSRSKDDINSNAFFSLSRIRLQENNLRLSRILNSICEKSPNEISNSLRFDTRFGQRWNKTNAPRSFKNWTETIPSMRIATSIEIPYARVAEKWEASPMAVRKFGSRIAQAVNKFFDD